MITIIKTKFKQLADLLDSRPATERGLIFVTAILVIFSLFHLALISPVTNSNIAAKETIERKTVENVVLRQELDILTENLRRAPKESVQTRLESLKKELNNTGEFSKLMNELISPQEMVRFVDGVLSSNKGITVVRAKNLTAVQLWPDLSNKIDDAQNTTTEDNKDSNKAASGEAFKIYKHGMLLEVKGRYRELVTFLVTLEQLPWKILWGDVNLSSDDDEKESVSTLVIYTLSPEKAWMGL